MRERAQSTNYDYRQETRAIADREGNSSYENIAIEHGISRMQYWQKEKGTDFTFVSFLKILDAHRMSLEEFFQGIEFQ